VLHFSVVTALHFLIGILRHYTQARTLGHSEAISHLIG
jgi:hypothetical protein